MSEGTGAALLAALAATLGVEQAPEEGEVERYIAPEAVMGRVPRRRRAAGIRRAGAGADETFCVCAGLNA